MVYARVVPGAGVDSFKPSAGIDQDAWAAKRKAKQRITANHLSTSAAVAVGGGRFREPEREDARTGPKLVRTALPVESAVSRTHSWLNREALKT